MKLDILKRVNYNDVLVGKTWKMKEYETIIHLSENGKGFIHAKSTKNIHYRINNNRLYFTYTAIPEYGELHETLEFYNDKIFLTGEELEELG